MKSKKSLLFMMVLMSTICLSTMIYAQPSSEKNSNQTAADVVTELYDIVTFSAGTTPDWEVAKALFIDEAVIVMRTSRTQMGVFSVQEWVDDFVTFIKNAKVDQTGFIEKIVNLKSVVLGDIAHCFVVYEASIPNRKRPPQRGLDSFQLVKKNEGWKIISIANEVPRPGHPIPEELLK